MGFESIMLSYFIPSQIMIHVRTALATVHHAVINYGIISNRNFKSMKSNNNDDNGNDYNNSFFNLPDKFSASHYFFPSVFVANMFPYLPESDFILLYRDPLPRFEFKTILSTRTDISCLSFLSKLGVFSISYKILSIFIFLNPLLL